MGIYNIMINTIFSRTVMKISITPRGIVIRWWITKVSDFCLWRAMICVFPYGAVITTNIRTMQSSAWPTGRKVARMPGRFWRVHGPSRIRRIWLVVIVSVTTAIIIIVAAARLSVQSVKLWHIAKQTYRIPRHFCWIWKRSDISAKNSKFWTSGIYYKSRKNRRKRGNNKVTQIPQIARIFICKQIYENRHYDK